jgi:hypothetical protein
VKGKALAPLGPDSLPGEDLIESDSLIFLEKALLQLPCPVIFGDVKLVAKTFPSRITSYSLREPIRFCHRAPIRAARESESMLSGNVSPLLVFNHDRGG